MKVFRVRYRKDNGRTEIIPAKFGTREEAQSFIDYMNKQLPKGIKSYELASTKNF